MVRNLRRGGGGGEGREGGGGGTIKASYLANYLAFKYIGHAAHARLGQI